jgi:hypothetical protein
MAEQRPPYPGLSVYSNLTTVIPNNINIYTLFNDITTTSNQYPINIDYNNYGNT